MKYIVYHELYKDRRWFYGMYDCQKANEVAVELNKMNTDNNYCVCGVSEVTELNIQNLPNYVYYELNKTK